MDAALLKWFNQVSPSVSISNEMLQEKSLQIAKLLAAKEVPDPERIKLATFKCSHGYIASWKARHHLVSTTLSEEAADVNQDVVKEARKEIANYLGGYEASDIYNLDELALFFKLQPQRVVAQKGKK